MMVLDVYIIIYVSSSIFPSDFRKVSILSFRELLILKLNTTLGKVRMVHKGYEQLVLLNISFICPLVFLVLFNVRFLKLF